MKNLILIVLLLVHTANLLYAQKVNIIKYPELERTINQASQDVAIFNFWATWCKPCIAEMPHIEKVRATYDQQKVGIFLISMDFAEDADSKVQNFIERREIKSEVMLLDETDFNAFIDKINPEWSGSIPATLIIQKSTGKKFFYEKAFKEGELESIIASLI